MSEKQLQQMAITACKSGFRPFSIDPARARRDNETPAQWSERLRRMDLGMASLDLTIIGREVSIECEMADRLIFRSRLFLAA